MKKLLSCLTLICLWVSPVYSAYIIRDGQLVSVDNYTKASFEELSSSFKESLEQKKLDQASKDLKSIYTNFGIQQAVNLLSKQEDFYFFMGVAAYGQQDFDGAFKYLDKYLKQHESVDLNYFYEGMQYKFALAEAYRQGAKRRPFGQQQLPKLLSGEDLALSIYDEITSSLPSDPLAAKALYSRGLLLGQTNLSNEAIDSFKALIANYPNDPLSLLAFKQVAKIYFSLSKLRAHNPYLLELAKLNIKHFSRVYPNDRELIAELESMLSSMEEVYAQKLVQLGELYVRKKQPQAALIYFYKAFITYPASSGAQTSKVYLQKHRELYKQLGLPEDVLDT